MINLSEQELISELTDQCRFLKHDVTLAIICTISIND